MPITDDALSRAVRQPAARPPSSVSHPVGSRNGDAVAIAEDSADPRPTETSTLRAAGPYQWMPTWFQVIPPHTITWHRYRLPMAGLPAELEGLRVLHLSDFHFRRRYQPVWDRLIERIQHDPPDLLLLTGDFVDSKRNPYPALPTVRRFLAGLRSRFGCFGIVGNHDDYTVAYELRDSGITFLDGKRHVLRTRGVDLEIIGLPGAERCDVEHAFIRRLPPKSAGVLRIVMSHHPDNFLRSRSLKTDLYFSGHTHGGQICLPPGIPIIKHDALPRRLTHGVHRVDQTWLVVSRGLGATEIPIRFFSPPEVIELQLVP